MEQKLLPALIDESDDSVKNTLQNEIAVDADEINDRYSLFYSYRVNRNAEKYKVKTKKKKSKKKKKKNKDCEDYIDDYRDCFREPIVPYNPEREGDIVPEYLLLNPRFGSGFHFGRKRGYRDQYVGKPHNCDGHIEVFGGSGSGKSFNNAKPTIITWKSPIFAVDIKGELIEVAKKYGRPCKVLDLSGSGSLYKYDPFVFMQQDGEENLAQNATDLANTIIPLPANIGETFWIDSARNTLTAAILYYYELGASFINAMISINCLGYADLINKILNEGSEIANAFICADVLSNPKMFAGISEQFRNSIRVFVTDPVVKNLFDVQKDSGDEIISFDDLENGDIFVRIEQRRLGQWGRVVSLIVTQLIRYLEGRPEKHTPEGEKTKPILLLLDEFPQLGKMDVISNALSTLRSKKVTIALFCQSLADLDSLYGKDVRRKINDNCPYKVILGASDVETQRYFSELVGTKKSISRSIGLNYSGMAEDINGIGFNIGECQQYVIKPHEFSSLNCAVLLHPDGFSLIENITHHIPNHPKNPDNKYLL